LWTDTMQYNLDVASLSVQRTEGMFQGKEIINSV
jgi:hypothetical protein